MFLSIPGLIFVITKRESAIVAADRATLNVANGFPAAVVELTSGHKSMRTLWTFVAGLAGGAIGLLVGTVGVFYGCVLYDKITYPNGVPAGGGLTAVGWIFVFITAPAGVIIGGILGVLCLHLKRRRAEGTSRDYNRLA